MASGRFDAVNMALAESFSNAKKTGRLAGGGRPIPTDGPAAIRRQWYGRAIFGLPGI
jgi:hypothetical protein